MIDTREAPAPPTSPKLRAMYLKVAAHLQRAAALDDAAQVIGNHLRGEAATVAGKQIHQLSLDERRFALEAVKAFYAVNPNRKKESQEHV